ncbi:S1 family peptidase [Streptomyces sp. PT12]|uniref:S1 family peptidase n=1 Tax=Streptomyces sp. PT12 TaxID=1510197 RepID=UPI000DE287A8|nr:S1 family peptidase [Streptomyces sp. PT12]RBM04767.1 serine protease [Streptomyces sp. PT12]
MTHRRTSYRRLAAAATGVAALLAGTFAVSQANAAPTPTPDVLTSAQAGELATTLTDTLGAEGAGTYFDDATGTLVVNVVDESAVSVVQEAGAEARLVERSLAELNEVKAQVEEFAVPGTSWTADPLTNTVKVTVDSTVTGGELAEVRDAVEALGSAATFEQRAGAYEPYIAGGDAIYSSGARCSLGFNVSVGGAPAFLTAGHCGSVGSTWSDSSGGGAIGTLTEGEFPGGDYALVQYTASVDNPSVVNRYDGTTTAISGAGEATVGQLVERSGSTTGLHGGQVTGTDVSVSYPQGTVHGTIETTVCAEPGDSGGSLFAGSTALGITSGGSGNCSSGGVTFFYPVVDALAATGASLP